MKNATRMIKPKPSTLLSELYFIRLLGALELLFWFIRSMLELRIWLKDERKKTKIIILKSYL